MANQQELASRKAHAEQLVASLHDIESEDETPEVEIDDDGCAQVTIKLTEPLRKWSPTNAATVPKPPLLGLAAGHDGFIALKPDVAFVDGGPYEHYWVKMRVGPRSVLFEQRLSTSEERTADLHGLLRQASDFSAALENITQTLPATAGDSREVAHLLKARVSPDDASSNAVHWTLSAQTHIDLSAVAAPGGGRLLVLPPMPRDWDAGEPAYALLQAEPNVYLLEIHVGWQMGRVCSSVVKRAQSLSQSTKEVLGTIRPHVESGSKRLSEEMAGHSAYRAELAQVRERLFLPA